MFWRKKVAAQAKILADEGSGWAMKSASVALQRQKYIIEVYPPGEPPFRVETKVWVSWLDAPGVGMMVNVLYVPGTQKAKIVIKGDPRFDWELRAAEKKQAAEAERTRLLNGPGGRPPLR
jgi:hypothetical protein